MFCYFGVLSVKTECKYITEPKSQNVYFSYATSKLTFTFNNIYTIVLQQ